MDGRKLNEAKILAAILEPTGRDEEGERWVYRCTLLTESGDCGAYHQRPTMCADYPYGVACSYDACTWEAARNGTARPPRHLPMWQPGEDGAGPTYQNRPNLALSHKSTSLCNPCIPDMTGVS